MQQKYKIKNSQAKIYYAKHARKKLNKGFKGKITKEVKTPKVSNNDDKKRITEENQRKSKRHS